MLRRKIDHFYVIRHLGSGGLLDVYLGVNPRTGERRAIKFLPRNKEDTQKAQPRFLREIDRARSLSHPRIVKVIEIGILEDCCYYSMPFYAGHDLSSRIGRSMPVLHAIRVAAAICDGLAYAHSRGVAHGNLKPSKVLVDGAGSPAIAGLGISCEDPDPPTNTLRALAYAPPEHRCGRRNPDRRADVYSMGAMLYAMITGFPPLGQYPKPGDVKPGVPAPLQTLLQRCLAADPQDRPCDAVAVHEALLEVSDNGRRVEPRKLDTDAAVECTPPSDRIQGWFALLRSGTTRERLSAVREMVDEMEPGEANAILKLYPHEEDRVRWGLIRVFGELRISAASPMIVAELENPFHHECAVEALGKIGSRDAFGPILEFLRQHPESAPAALLPLASTGDPRALQHLRPYLSHPRAAMRQSAIRAVAAIGTTGALEALRAHLLKELDEKLRAETARCIQAGESPSRDQRQGRPYA